MPDKGSIFNNESDLEEIRKRIKEIQKEKEDSYKKIDEPSTPEQFYGEYCDNVQIGINSWNRLIEVLLS